MSAAGSRVVLDLWYLPDEHDLMAAARRFSSNLLALLGEPVTFGIHPEDVAPFFQRLGFRVDDLAGADKLHKLYFKRRGPIYPTSYLVHAVARRKR